MTLEQFIESLAINGVKAKLYEKKSRVYLQSGKDSKFIEYIQHNDDETFGIRVYLRDKEFGEKPTSEEWKAIFTQRDKLIERFNKLNLGITFDEKGISQTEGLSDLDLIMSGDL